MKIKKLMIKEQNYSADKHNQAANNGPLKIDNSNKSHTHYSIVIFFY